MYHARRRGIGIGTLVLTSVLSVSCSSTSHDAADISTSTEGVTKATPTTSILHGATIYSAGSVPTGVVYDGSHLWVVDAAENVLSVEPATGATTTYPAGGFPLGIAFDGT